MYLFIFDKWLVGVWGLVFGFQISSFCFDDSFNFSIFEVMKTTSIRYFKQANKLPIRNKNH